MDLSSSGDSFLFADHGPVTEDLWSDYLRGPFAACTVCGRELEGGIYEIQKVTNKHDTLLEMSVCLSCSQSLAAEFSAESAERIRNFLTENLRMTSSADLCNLCGRPHRDAESVSTLAVCSSRRLLLPVIHTCAVCEESMQGLLSEKTRRAHDEFMNRTFPGIPADFDLTPKILL